MSLFTNARDVAKQAARDVLCGAGGIYRALDDIFSKSPVDQRSGAIQRLDDRIGDALTSFCPVPPQAPALPQGPGFNGGQCPTAYVVRVRISGEQSINGFFIPPDIQPGFVISEGIVQGPFASVITNAPGPQPAVTQPVWSALDSDGIGKGSGSTEIERSPEWSGAGRRFYRNLTAQVQSVVRLDGLPDDCGEPPPTFPPGTPPPSNPRPPGTTINIDLPDIGPIDVDFNPTVGLVYVDVDGSIQVPVTVNVSFAPDFDFDLDFNVDLGDPTADPTPPIDPFPDNPDGRPQPEDCPPPDGCRRNPDVEPGDDAEGEEEDLDRVIVGAYVASIVDQIAVRATRIFQQNGPDIYAPALGYLRFRYELPGGGDTWGTDIPIKVISQVIEAPDPGLRCIGAVVNPDRGVGMFMRLISVPDTGCN